MAGTILQTVPFHDEPSIVASGKAFDLENAGHVTYCETTIKVEKCCLVWSIKNFSHCPQAKDDALPSCTFSTKESGLYKFQLYLYPRGTSNKYYDVRVGIDLITDNDQAKVFIGYRCCLVSDLKDLKVLHMVQGTRLLEPGNYSHFFTVMEHEHLRRRQSDLYPEDTLTLICALTISSSDEGQKLKSKL